MSCQLITSASLLANRDQVKEAKKIVVNNNNMRRSFKPPSIPPPAPPKSTGPPAILNPRNYQVPSQNRSIIVDQTTQTQTTKIIEEEIIEINQQDRDLAKPPPMETMI
jgi:hypothetical protein